MLTIAKLIGGPGSWGFLVAAGLLTIAVFRSRSSRAMVLAFLVAAHAALGVPVIATAFADRLGPCDPLRARASISSTDTLAVLGGDNGEGRERETRRLLVSKHPERAIVLGDPGIVRAMVEARMPQSRLVDDHGVSATTREQVAYLARLPRAQGRLVVVASCLQMPRVVRLARAAGLDITPAASDLDEPLPSRGIRRWLPSIAGLHASRDAVYEHAALAYYAARGWLDRQERPANSGSKVGCAR